MSGAQAAEIGSADCLVSPVDGQDAKDRDMVSGEQSYDMVSGEQSYGDLGQNATLSRGVVGCPEHGPRRLAACE